MQQVIHYFFLLLLLSLRYFIDRSNCFILQLPECGRYNGNFTERHQHKYFTSANISKTIKNVTHRECALHCIFHLGCLFFNHKMDHSACELLTSHDGQLVPKPDWQFVSTSYKDVRSRGPFCRYLGTNVCSPSKGEHCIDTCTTPGFQCKKDEEIVDGITAKASSIYKTGFGVKKAIDGQLSTYWAPKNGPGSWLLVDLGSRRFVAYLRWAHVAEENVWYRMKPLRIRVGNKDESDLDGNAICADDVDISHVRKDIIYCSEGPMWGRYIVLQKKPTPNNERFYVSSVRVYTLF